jgi:hypothetical protein
VYVLRRNGEATVRLLIAIQNAVYVLRRNGEATVRLLIAIITLAGTLAAQAIGPIPTELQDHEKVVLMNMVGDVKRLLEDQKALNEKINAAGAALESHVEGLRKPHNAVGCAMDYNVMRFHNCTLGIAGGPVKTK